MLRVYICPVVGSGTKQDPYRSKAHDFAWVGGAQISDFIPSRLDGTPASPWAVSVIRTNDFAPITGDATCDDLFAGDLPAGVQTRDDLLALIRARTVGDVPAGRRAAIQAVLDKYAVPRADFTLATPLWRVMQRVASTLFEKDDNFAASF